MSYSLNQLVYDPDLRQRSIAWLNEYKAKFLGTMMDRINELTQLVNQSPGFEDWKPDYSESSIQSLGDWLDMVTDVRPRTEAEIDEITSKLKFNAVISGIEYTLTKPTLSFAADIGIYFGITLNNKYPKTKWEQVLKPKNSSDFGHVVLTGFGRVELNPLRILYMYSRSSILGGKNKSRLIDLYHIWSGIIKENSD